MGQTEHSIGDQVRLRRREMGLTQEQLAQRAGVTLTTIRNIERGRTERSYRLGQVLAVLGLEMLDERAPGRDLSDEDLIRETRRRAGDRAGEVLRGLLAAERRGQPEDSRKTASSRTDNDAASA